MKQTWLTGLSKEQKEKFEKEFKNSRPVLERLIAICNDKYKAADHSAIMKDKYEMPSWSEYQADTNGTKRTLLMIIKLLEI